jgi:hypothetical protein
LVRRQLLKARDVTSPTLESLAAMAGTRQPTPARPMAMHASAASPLMHKNRTTDKQNPRQLQLIFWIEGEEHAHRND